MMGNASSKISFEFFPPRTLDAAFALWDTAQILAPLGPEFVSVTYGAGGTARDLTHQAVSVFTRKFGFPVAAHLTCIDANCDETLEIAEQYAAVGVREIVALRGDPPKGSRGFAPHPDGFADSVALVEALAATGRFILRVAAYPDAHPEASDPAADIAWLKRKFAAGASSAITQFFFEAETFLRFRDRCEKAGIQAPIIPGILPLGNWEGARGFAQRCGMPIPQWLDDAFRFAGRDGQDDLLALAIAAELCDTLRSEGVEHFHFYTLNRPHLTRDLCYALGVVPDAALRKVAQVPRCAA